MTGYKVCIVDPDPRAPWPNNYGVWVDEFEAMGLTDYLEVVWPKANVFLDSSDKGEKCVLLAVFALRSDVCTAVLQCMGRG